MSVASLRASVLNDSARFHTKDTIKDAVVRNLRFDNKYAVPTLFIKDSVNDEFYRTLPYFKTTLYPGYLGVVGQAAYSLSFFDNKPITDNPFITPFSLSFYSKDDKSFYNTRRPFTTIRFVGSSNVFESFKALHTQNITKEWNIGFEMNFYGSAGAYNYQKASTHQMKAFTTYFGPRYSVVGQYSFNRLFTQENGGINDVSSMRDTNFNIKRLVVSLYDASSTNRFTQLYFKQEFNLSGRYRKPDSLNVELNEFPICLGHEMTYDRSFRTYTEKITSAAATLYYPNKGLDSVKTKDSALSKTITNFAYLKVSANRKKSNVQTIIGGFGIESEKYIFADHEKWDKNSLFNNGFIQSSLWNRAKSHKGFDAYARYYISGRKQQNVEVKSSIYADIHQFDSTRFEASIETQIASPSYFYNTYRSNHFSWKNPDLAKQQNLTLVAKIASLYDKYHIKASATAINNYVYITDTMSVQQYKPKIIVYAIDAGKRTNWGILYLSNNIILQNSTSKIISIPTFTTVNTIAIKTRLFKKTLLMKTGFDIYYWSKFYAPAYTPELGVFHKQTSRKIGDYPFVDAFVQFDFKRMQLFLKYSHASYYVTTSNTFSSVDRYPLDKPAFSYGLSWYFYN